MPSDPSPPTQISPAIPICFTVAAALASSSGSIPTRSPSPTSDVKRPLLVEPRIVPP